MGKAFCCSHLRVQKQILGRVKIYFWSWCSSNLFDELSFGNQRFVALTPENIFIYKSDLKNLTKMTSVPPPLAAPIVTITGLYGYSPDKYFSLDQKYQLFHILSE